MKKIMILAVLIVALTFSIGFATAAVPAAASASGLTDEGIFVDASGDHVDVTDGHIYSLNVDANMSTIMWAGLTGNVTGNIVLGDDDSSVLYQWTAAGLMVYASEGTPTWASLADANEAAVTGVYSHLATGKSDSYDQTFSGSESIGSNIFSTLSSDYATTLDNASAAVWKTYSLTDGTNVVFAGAVSEDGTNYKGMTADYQMILPEDGTAGDTAATSYNLWVELQ